MSHVLKFPGTKKLDASFPSVLRDSETWNTAREDLQRAMSVSKDVSSDEDHAPFYPRARSTDDKTRLAWGDRTRVLQNELTNEIAVLKRHIHQREIHLLRQRVLLVSILKVTQSNPLMAGDLLREGCMGLRRDSSRWLRRVQGRCVARGDGNQHCRHAAIPYSKYCMEHITADKQQVLYRSCMATDQDTLVRCNGVVVDILSEKGLCPLHLASDSEVKKSITRSLGGRVKSTQVKLKLSRKPMAVMVASPPVPGSPVSIPGPPPLVSALGAAADQQSQPAPSGLSSSSWISAKSDAEQSHTASLPPLTTLPHDPNDPLMLFSTSEAPSTLPSIDLLPLDPTLHGNIMDDSSSNSN